MFVGLELLKASSCYEQTRLFYWLREEKNNCAEIDFVIQQNMKTVPVEVKSGKQGKMQSMHLFIKEKNVEYGIRMSLENFGQYDKIKVIPLYAVEKLVIQTGHNNL